MIENSKYSTTMPAASSGLDASLTTVQIDKLEVLRKNLALAANAGLSMKTAATDSGNSQSRLVKFSKTYVGTDAAGKATSYEVSAHMVVKFDKRFAVDADISGVVASLLTWSLEKASETAEYNIMRLAKGEL